MHSTLGIQSPVKDNVASAPLTELQLVEVPARESAAVRFRRWVAVVEMFVDLCTIVGAVLVSYLAYYDLHFGKHIYYPVRAVVSVACVFGIIAVLMLGRVGAYERGVGLLRVRETEKVLRVSAQTFLVAFAVSFFSNFLVSRWLLLILVTTVPLALCIEKHIVYTLVRRLHSKGYGIERVLIYGAGSTGRQVYSALKRSPKLGFAPIAFVDDDYTKTGSIVFEMGYERRPSAPVVGGPIRRELLTQCDADMVIVAVPTIDRTKFLETVREALAAKCRVAVVPSHFFPSDVLIEYEDIDGVLLASFGNGSRMRGYDIVKRIGDILGSILLLIMGAPLFALLAILIRLDSEGPALFSQERGGHQGRRFKMYKFRTMFRDAPQYEYCPSSQSDPRITRLGKFLRRTSLDELPQLVNVLKGNMSLVGPRPEMPFIVEQYAERHRQRLQVKPGLTGLWQLSGDRGCLIHENIEYDLYYIQNRGIFMDFAILLHTVIFAMRGI